MADYDWFERTETQVEKDRKEWTPKGLTPVSDGVMNGRTMYFRCHRGCGTLVWNPQAHIMNVCTTWNGEQQ